MDLIQDQKESVCYGVVEILTGKYQNNCIELERC